MAAIITDQLRILNAKNFVAGVGSTANSYYSFVGLPNATKVSSTWDITPPAPKDSFDQEDDYWDTMIGLKKISSSDVRQVIKRNSWLSGTTYDMYRGDITRTNTSKPSGATSLYGANYFVVNEDYRVYICLNNGTNPENPNGKSSLDQPTFVDLEPKSAGDSGDGYIWKYLYTIKPNDLVKFDSRDLLIKTSFTVADFEPSSECESCHPTHYKEWSGSMHAYAFTDPVWFKQHSKEQEHFNSKDKELGQFCIMCHSPVGFLTGAIEDPYTFDISQKESLATQVKEGISCSFCHATTHLSPSTNVDFSNNINEGIQFFLNPGEVKYGSIKDPLPNNFHESEFHPDYDKSEYCRACHNLTISGKDAEMTFNEWSQTSFEAMGIECQSCHMESYSGYAVDTELFPNAPYRKNLHRHNFIGIDHALTPFPDKDAQLESINSLLYNESNLD